MLRFLVLISALCVIMLVGYIAMDRDSDTMDSVTASTRRVEPSRKKLSGDIAEATKSRAKVDAVFARSKGIVKSIVNGAKAKIQKMTGQTRKETAIDEGSVKMKIAKKPEFTGSADPVMAGREKTLQQDGPQGLQIINEGDLQIDNEKETDGRSKDRDSEDIARKWVVLEETQQILSDTGEILK